METTILIGAIEGLYNYTCGVRGTELRGLMRGITGVTIWVIGVISLRTKSP